MSKKSDFIPAHIWRFCEAEIENYPLRKKELNEAERQIEAFYEEGGDKGYDPVFVVVHGNSSPIEAQLQKIEKAKQDRQFILNEKNCRIIEEVLAQLTQREFELIERFYWRHQSKVLISIEMEDMSPRTQERIRRRVIQKIATRWGML